MPKVTGEQMDAVRRKKGLPAPEPTTPQKKWDRAKAEAEVNAIIAANNQPGRVERVPLGAHGLFRNAFGDPLQFLALPQQRHDDQVDAHHRMMIEAGTRRYIAIQVLRSLRELKDGVWIDDDDVKITGDPLTALVEAGVVRVAERRHGRCRSKYQLDLETPE